MTKTNKRWHMTLLVVAIALIAAACGGGDDAASADSSGSITIELNEFEISPGNITAKVGDTVTIKIKNTGVVPHEWMMGREVENDEGFADGFHQNFFADSMSLEVMPMDAAMGMPDMEMTETTMAGMEDEMAHGFMVMREPGEEATVTFTVTADQVGEWEMACFVDDGAHYDAGMTGTFTVES
jgi:uncharacterized cupredoxin-like copper-binding protein